ncbi:MAG TPA: lyase family protein [Thermoanaerobaculia bacterium]|nr:lyase family protein [Thermoanaerobaculia bacterium]
MSRLWDRGEPLDEGVARFTVGRDADLDRLLVAHDALGSAAHAVMLGEIGVLAPEQVTALLRELAAVAREARSGSFTVAPEEEDGHTALENRLVGACGEAGRRIHTGRSRNDQVIAALRLWGREAVLELAEATAEAAGELLRLAAAHRDTSLPGYSHGRQAMPSTLGFLFAAIAEGLIDSLPWLERAFAHLDRSPLGSASGYGVALPLDRRQVAELLAFDSVQGNALAVQNDRGKTEMLVLGAALAPVHDLSRLAADLLWLGSDELGCVRLAPDVTTGSSLMPNKRNPDVLELVRAGAARLAARHAEVTGLWHGLASGYHRDLQLTKGPFVEGLRDAVELVRVTVPVLGGLEVDAARCRSLIARAAGATDALYARVAAGATFRAAYREVAADSEAAVEGDPAEGWRRRTHLGAPGALDLAAAETALAQARRRLRPRRERVAEVWRLLPRG